MECRRLGHTGLLISPIGLGANTFGMSVDDPGTKAMIDRAFDLGITYIDTADTYGKTKSEEFIGKAIKGRRNHFILATKFGLPLREGPNQSGGSRYYVIKAVEASLRRLQTDYIDLYQLHHPDPTTPIEETLRVLDDIVKSGKVRYIGCSNFAGWQLCEALWTSKFYNLHSFITIQSRYNLLDRHLEAEVVPCCQAYHIGVIPWGPLAGGFLTGKYHRGEKIPPSYRLAADPFLALYDHPLTEVNWNKLAKLESFAKDRGHTVGELAIAWLLAKPYIRTVLVGSRTTEQLTAIAAGANWKLTADEVAQLDAISAPG